MVNEHTKVKAICEALRRDLQCGRPSSRPLPSERALMRRFAAARETVRRALDELQRSPCLKKWLYEEFCGTNPVSAVRLRWHQRGFANATPDMLCAQSQRTICTKLPWVALKTAAKTRIEMEWRSRYGSANDMRSFLRSVSGASLIRIGVSTKNSEEPKISKLR